MAPAHNPDENGHNEVQVEMGKDSKSRDNKFARDAEAAAEAEAAALAAAQEVQRAKVKEKVGKEFNRAMKRLSSYIEKYHSGIETQFRNMVRNYASKTPALRKCSDGVVWA